MQITNLSTDSAVLTEFGARLARIRLNQNLSQSALAERAGVTRLTVHNIESGSNANFQSVIRVMRGLGILANLEAAVPAPAPSPLRQADAAKAQRKRAGRPRGSRPGGE
jgi:transcriptional regulator with XRE-family HTH domain